MVLKEKLVRLIRRRYCDPGQVRMDSPHQVMQVLESIKPDVLKIGFARRFATYKRALLLFTDLDRLAAIVNNKERPVQFIFAGKAHPNDQPGQDLIKRIIEVAAMPQFSGKIIFCRITTWSWRVAWCRAWTCGSIPLLVRSRRGYVG